MENLGTTFKVNYMENHYVLEKAPHYVWDSDEEHFIDEYKLWKNEIEVSYDLEDNNIEHSRKIHHIFVKKMYNARKQCFYYCFWTLKEYFPGDSLLWFDYGAAAPNEYHPFGKHQKERLISINAAKKFCEELLETYLQLLELNYLPYRFNDNGIIMYYENDKICWKFVEYHYFEKAPVVNIDSIRTVIMNFKSMLCWLLCQYTNHSTHHLATPNIKHPFWTGLSDLIDSRYKTYGSGQYKSPPSSLQELTENITLFLNYARNN